MTPAELPIREEAWRDLALCREVDPELFFPPKGASPAVARTVCVSCEVRSLCLDWALAATPLVSGIWGGTTETERERLRKAGPTRTPRAA